MTIDEAIKYAEDVAKKQENNAKNYPRPDRSVRGSGKKYNAYLKSAEEHRQLAEWLKDYKRLLEQEPCAVLDINENHHGQMPNHVNHQIWEEIKALPPVTPAEKVGRWIPVKWHEITDEEREREGYPKEWACHLDSIMPYDGQRILITTKGGYVELDECYSDDGCTFSLDSGYDWVDDVVAWCELPEPYKSESEDVPDINDGNLYRCPCGYGWDKSKVVRHHFCPNCGAKVAEGGKE